MTREEVYNKCLAGLTKSKFLLLQIATGYGKTRLALDLVKHLLENEYKGRETSLLIVVSQRTHKITWKEEIKKWGGIEVNTLKMDCYQSLKNHCGKHYDFIICDEIHHLKSDLRLGYFEQISFDYAFGLSATIPFKFISYLRYQYKALLVSCDIAEAIEDNVLPIPQILLLPLALDDTKNTETWEINPKAKGPVIHAEYKDRWQYKNKKVHAILKCTPKQKLSEYNALILWEKNKAMRSKAMEFKWLRHCGERLEWLAYMKNDLIYKILRKLDKSRTITFCKTIEQSELLGKYCIHSKNKYSDIIYEDFNKKKINHITAVNILNENANLVDCKYAIFSNYSSSDIVSFQRLGRALRHKSPVIILPYYENTREQEIIENTMLRNLNKDYVKVIHSINEIK